MSVLVTLDLKEANTALTFFYTHPEVVGHHDELECSNENGDTLGNALMFGDVGAGIYPISIPSST